MVKLVLFIFCLAFLCEITTTRENASCAPIRLKNGRTRYRQKGRFVKFMCNVGFLIAGEKYSTCHNGVWDTVLPKCVRANCKNVTTPSNGLIYPSHRGAVLNFFCKPGYELKGPNATYCDGYSWDNKLPSCHMTNTQPALSCDFESEDLCGWNHDIKHDFDWTRGSLQTPSGHLGTGPSSDHSRGDGHAGHYMYIEASSRTVNDTARLISPIYDPINTSACLEFHYHMYGTTTGQLRVYLKKELESWNLSPERALFWKSGNHGDRWIQSWTEIGPIDEDFQIIFEGVRGSSYFSDIAIDDVAIIPNCSNINSFTTEMEIIETMDDYVETFPTCLNRCVSEYNATFPNNSSCGCDDGCSDKNTCCSDYINYCVLGATDDYTIQDESTAAFHESSTPNLITYKLKSTPEEIEKETVQDSNSLPELIGLTTQQPTTIKEGLRPQIEPKPWTLELVTKIQMPTTVILKEFTPKIANTDGRNTYFRSSSRPPIVKETNVRQVQIFGNATNLKGAISSGKPTDAKLVVIIIISLIFVSLITTTLFFVVKKYKYVNCRRLNKATRNGSDSQSDVRFLTSDEILNFNLATPDDY